jgi:hypothetical protein
VSLAGRYSAESRPDGSYYCYDCHGYRFFDPYYDYCSNYGFRYRWDDHPRAMLIYRDRYVRIRRAHPEYGRYRYRAGYRDADRYREPVGYEDWRRGDSQGSRDEKPAYERPGDRGKGRGRREGREEWNERKERKGANEGKKEARKHGKERKGSGRGPS